MVTLTDTARAGLARRAAEAGGEVAASYFRSDLGTETKANPNDFVTRADREAQERVIELIEREATGETIVAEEDDALKSVPSTGPAWVIDPIDGTNNFVRGIDIWTTSVAAVIDAESVGGATVMPCVDSVYSVGPNGAFRNDERISVSDRSDPGEMSIAPLDYWEQDERDAYAATLCDAVRRFGTLRRFWCVQATLAYVASGALDAAVTDRTVNPWDSIVGVHLIREAGGTVTDLEGERWKVGCRGLVASNGHCHHEALQTARAAL